MHISASLAADLAMLNSALDDPDEDLAHTVQNLATDAATAVPSFAGLTVVATIAGDSFVLNALDDRAGRPDIAASLQLTVASPDRGGREQDTSVSVVLYARTPGAFADLAADGTWLDLYQRVVLDQHLVPPTGNPTRERLYELSLFNQAVGVLLARGRTPQQARDEIDATTTGPTDRNTVVARILAGLDGPDGPGDRAG